MSNINPGAAVEAMMSADGEVGGKIATATMMAKRIPATSSSRHPFVAPARLRSEIPAFRN